MKLLLTIPNGVNVADVEALLAGSAAAAGTPKIPTQRIDERKPQIEFIADILCVPIRLVEAVVLDKSKVAETLNSHSILTVKTTPAEYAILAQLQSKINPPF